jgi:DNA-binding MarR family transcriptional regulator
MTDEQSTRSWTFLTNHAHVLLAIAATPDLRLREIADLVGITERTAMQIVVDLEEDGYLRRERRGRRNHYTVEPRLHLRHRLEEHHEVSDLLDALRHRPPEGTADRDGDRAGAGDTAASTSR